jgi:hypothetical protein
MSEALSCVDRDTLLAERAEAEAQLRAAEATLGASSKNDNNTVDGGVQQEREEPVQKPHNVQVEEDPVVALDVAALREAAAQARLADDELAAAASEATEQPPAAGTELDSAEGALARALAIREELPATWRRLVGALISATGMAIVVGALGWSVYWLLVPIALIAILTVDLRLAGKAAREASDEAALELATVGGGTDGLDRIRHQRSTAGEVEARLEAARAGRDAAYDRFEELAPGRHPSEVDDIIAEYEAEQAERAARAKAQAEAEAEAARVKAEEEAEAARVEAQARAKAEADAKAEAEAEAQASTDVSVDPEPEEPEPAAPVTASEWWFGTKEAPAAPAAAAAPVRALAERLSAEGREALARIEAQLDALDRVELARKSLEWHEANGSTKPADTAEKS